MLHLALFYESIDLWLAFYITMDDVTVRSLIGGQHTFGISAIEAIRNELFKVFHFLM
jgi:hypothetical protein